MGGISVAHGGNRVPSLIHESPESLQLQKRGNNTMTSRVDTTPHDVELQPYSLTADWGSDIRATPPWEDIESSYARFRNPDKPGTISDFSREST